jgi:Ca2+-binding EF-hand superfamily protein
VKFFSVNADELETLSRIFESLATPSSSNSNTFIVDEATFQKRMGLAQVTDTAFVKSFFRACTKHASQQKTSDDDMDIRAFLLALGIIFKGTVEEKLKCMCISSSFHADNIIIVAFAIYDMDEDGLVDLSDMLAITKSCLISSIYLAQYCREEYESDENVRIKTTEFEVSLHVNNRNICDTRVSVTTDISQIVQNVLHTQV